MDNANKKRVYSITGIVFTVVILAAAAVFLIYLFGSTNEDTQAVFGEDSVQFTGMYGKTYAYADIKGVTLKDSIPAVGTKTDGSGLGDVKKGSWNVEGMGNCRLFIMSASGPFVVMDTSGGYVIISCKDAQKTRALYEDLLKKL